MPTTLTLPPALGKNKRLTNRQLLADPELLRVVNLVRELDGLPPIGKRLPKWRAQRDFLRIFRNSGVLLVAAQEAQVSRRTIYRWLQQDRRFKADFQEAELDHIDLLQQKLMERIEKGDSLALRLRLKSLLPEKYGEP